MNRRAALPLLGLAAGSVLGVVGGAQLVSVWLARPGELSTADKWKVGTVAALFVGLGTVLGTVSGHELSEALDDAA